MLEPTVQHTFTVNYTTVYTYLVQVTLLAQGDFLMIEKLWPNPDNKNLILLIDIVICS